MLKAVHAYMLKAVHTYMLKAVPAAAMICMSRTMIRKNWKILPEIMYRAAEIQKVYSRKVVW